MGKRSILFAGAIVISAAYDFYRGYHENRSIFGGVVWVIGGFVVLALLWCFFSMQRSKNQ
jgi:hypothetical protein